VCSTHLYTRLGTLNRVPFFVRTRAVAPGTGTEFNIRARASGGPGTEASLDDGT
jgi:hypothetical protein